MIFFEFRVREIEKTMLVDLEELYPELFEESFRENSAADLGLDKHFLKMFEQIAAENRVWVAGETKLDIAYELSVWIIGIAGKKILVSAGILAAGTGASWGTFGATLILAIVGDMVFSWAWDKYMDPKVILPDRFVYGLNRRNGI